MKEALPQISFDCYSAMIISTTAIPEPTSLLILGGIVGMFVFSRRRD